MRQVRLWIVGGCILSAFAVADARQGPSAPRSSAVSAYSGWPAYGGGPEQIRYSSLTQINRSNVRQLQVAWTYDSAEAGGYRKFLDPDGYPAIAPPWGTLNAINLNTGKYAWKIPLGEYPELAAQGMNNTGSENYGGPVVTAGGLVFIAATSFDRKFRAFDKATGELLWEAMLPFSGSATPSTYEVDGRPFVVPAGGGRSRPNSPAGSGGAYVAFAVPKDSISK